MTDELTAAEFEAAAGFEDWRVLFNGANAYFSSGTFALGLALVEEIGRLATAGAAPVDIDLRAEGVTVVLPWSPTVPLSGASLALAREISAAARGLGVRADPGNVQFVQLAIDAFVSAEVLPFWRAVLGYDQVGDEDLLDRRRRGPSVWFQSMAPRRQGRNRIHLDLSLPHDQARARIEAALAAGGRIVFEDEAPMWWTLADPEGNEVDIATMEGRD